MDTYSVIYLGHTRKQPLIGSSSELVDGSEPHGQFTLSVRHALHADGVPVGGGVPGVVQTGWYREGAIPGTQPSRHLRLI